MPSFTFISESLRFSRTDIGRVYFDFHRRLRDLQDMDYRDNLDYNNYEEECYFVEIGDHLRNNRGRYMVDVPVNGPNQHLEYEIVGAVLGGHPTFRIHYGTAVDNLMQLRYGRIVESHFTMNENQVYQWINMNREEDFLGEGAHRRVQEDMEID